MSLFVILMFLFTAVSGDDVASFTVRLGEDVTLPCGNVIEDQTRCDKTSWLFSRDTGGAAVELITDGIISKDAGAEAKRLSVTGDCSLVIKNVKRDDVGRYSCRQFRSGEQVGPEARVLLYGIDIEMDDPFRFYCIVFRYGACVHTVQWYYKGDETDISEQKQTCAANVMFTTEVQKLKLNELFCNVTDQSGQTLTCNSISESPCEKTESTNKNRKTSEEKEDHIPGSGWIRFISVSVGLAVLIIISVTVIIWARIKGNKTQTDQNSVENDEGEASVIYENSRGPDASVRFQ